ncbi:MAG TPA: hypothetical protein VFR78_14950 [Pyrinomonadaceae bacterium]|nr:hypothetical protein [Pyrinomonadaceae bacterium]
MDRIRGVLQSQWRAYWRRLRGAGTLRTSNAGPLVLLGGLFVVRYLQQLPVAASQLAKGETTRYEALLTAVFLAWLFPVMGETRRSITSRALLHLPFTANDLFLIRLGSAFISPVSWIIVACSLALCYPVALARHPLTGTLALLILLLLGLFTSLTVTHLLNSAVARVVILGVLLVATAIGGLVWLAERNEVVETLTSVLPDRLAAAAAVSSAPVRSLAVLAGMTAVVGFLALRTFSLTLQPRQNQRSQSFTFLGLIDVPGRYGGLLKKDVRHYSRLLDIYFAVPIVLLFNMYLVGDTAPSAIAFFVTIGILFLPCISLAFNSFGLDRPLGLDRYTLFPLSDKQKLFSKNLAFGTIVMILFVTILPLTVWKLGMWTSVLGMIELIVVWLAYVSYGNWLSVREPFKMQFYRFASGGSPVDAVMGVIFGSVPVALTVYLVYNEGNGALWKLVLMTVIYLAIFLFSLSRSARLLESHQENIRRALS